MSFNNANGSSRFRIGVDSANSLHMHFGKTNKLRKIHRTGLVNGIIGGLTGVWSEEKQKNPRVSYSRKII